MLIFSSTLYTLYWVERYLEDKSHLVVIMLWNRIQLLKDFMSFPLSWILLLDYALYFYFQNFTNTARTKHVLLSPDSAAQPMHTHRTWFLCSWCLILQPLNGNKRSYCLQKFKITFKGVQERGLCHFWFSPCHCYLAEYGYTIFSHTRSLNQSVKSHLMVDMSLGSVPLHIADPKVFDITHHQTWSILSCATLPAPELTTAP